MKLELFWKHFNELLMEFKTPTKIEAFGSRLIPLIATMKSKNTWGSSVVVSVGPLWIPDHSRAELTHADGHGHDRRWAYDGQLYF